MSSNLAMLSRHAHGPPRAPTAPIVAAHLGFGLGLRPPHYAAAAAGAVPVDWLEVISENFMVDGGNPRRVLRAARSHYPVVLHGVSMSLGSVDPLEGAYLDRLRALADEVEPAWISDHLCWSSFGGHTGHDLWPLPLTDEALAHVARRVTEAQDHLGRRLLVENVSSYLTFRHSTIPEWQFLNALAQRTGCGLLLDVNNVYVNARNHGFDPVAFIDGIAPEHVGQIHLAGHSDKGAYLLDTHDHPVGDPVWRLYEHTIARLGALAPTLLERDDHIPDLPELIGELRRARTLATAALATAASSPAAATGPAGS